MWWFGRWCDSGFPLSVIILPVYASRYLTLQITEIPDDEGDQDEAVLSVRQYLFSVHSAQPVLSVFALRRWKKSLLWDFIRTWVFVLPPTFLSNSPFLLAALWSPANTQTHTHHQHRLLADLLRDISAALLYLLSSDSRASLDSLRSARSR